jgi:hypothetical protein
MFQQFKLYFILAAIAVVLGMGATIGILSNNLKKEKARANREAENTKQLLNEKDSKIATLQLTTAELIAFKDQRLDSVFKALRIEKKRVSEVITIKEYVHDTIPIIVTPDPIIINGTTVYPVKIEKNCLTIIGQMTVKDTIPTFKLKETIWDNNIDIVTYWERKKILLLRIGKKQYLTTAKADCGEVKIRDIKIVKKE